MSDEPEEGFTFRDRRRVHVDPTPAPAPAAQPAPAPVVDEIEEEDEEEFVAPPGVPDPFAGVPTPQPETVFIPGMGEVPMGVGEAEPGEDEVPDIYMQLYEFMMFLRSMAALRLGVIPNPSTNRFEKDLDQARVAIDTVTFLAQQLEPVLPNEERLPLRAMVTDLRMRYVEETKR